MFLRHGMVKTDENIVFGSFNFVRTVFSFFGGKSGKFYSTAGKRTFPKGGNNVSANGADVKFRFFNISGAVFVDYAFAGKKFRNRNAEDGGKGFDKGYVRKALFRSHFETVLSETEIISPSCF